MSVGQAIILIFVILCLAYPVWVALRSINWKRSETTDLRKSAAGFWITVGLLAVLVEYPLSFGPACWACTLIGNPPWAVRLYLRTYAPILWVYANSPKPIQEATEWYCGLVSPP